MWFLSVVFIASSCIGAVIEDKSLCSYDQFACGDGECISGGLLCDGTSQCRDGSDETACHIGFSRPDDVFSRSKRQAACRKTDWTCNDGTCISFDGKCDGMVDCPDGSDEKHALCRNTKCQPNWFRCTYGACVDGTAPCNGVKECADNSDELLSRCRNSTDEQRGQFRCKDGTFIPGTSLCDGVPDCPDGSDEIVAACADKTCPSYLFQCAYGACVDQGADCNGKTDCADRSDEAEDLCSDRSGGSVTSSPPASGRCKLPPYPEHGGYKVTNIPGARPGDSYANLVLNLTCRTGYILNGNSRVHCNDGDWSIPVDQFPKCTRYCMLRDEPSVRYSCILSGDVQGSRPCQKQEPSGTIVNVECNTPNYYTITVLPQMRCIDGIWDKTPTCTPGLPRTGTNITVIVKDKVSIHISNFEYASPIADITPITPITLGNEGTVGISSVIADVLVNGGNSAVASAIRPVNFTITGDGVIINPVNQDKPQNVGLISNEHKYKPVTQGMVRPVTQARPISPVQQVTPSSTTEIYYDYDIDVLDWRMARPEWYNKKRASKGMENNDGKIYFKD